MIEPAMARCGRTPTIVAAILDGSEVTIDRAHLAACATCRRGSERAGRFTRSLVAVAAAASDGIPDPNLLRRDRRPGLRIGNFDLRPAPLVTLAAAVAVGLLIAPLIGRIQPPAGQLPSAFASAATATEALAPLGLACAEGDTGAVCRSTAPDHVHRVALTVTDGRVVAVEARIESTDGTDLDLSGVETFLVSIAAAVLMPEPATGATSWIRDAYPGCGAGCSLDLEEIGLAMAKEGESVTLSLREH